MATILNTYAGSIPAPMSASSFARTRAGVVVPPAAVWDGGASFVERPASARVASAASRSNVVPAAGRRAVRKPAFSNVGVVPSSPGAPDESERDVKRGSYIMGLALGLVVFTGILFGAEGQHNAEVQFADNIVSVQQASVPR